MTRENTSYGIIFLFAALIIVGVAIAFIPILIGYQEKAGDLSQPLPRDNSLEVPYVVTPDVIVEKMLEKAEITEDDLVYDLGCGDGRIVIAAAKKYGCRAKGYDIDERLIRLCKAKAIEEGVEDLVEFYCEDIYKIDFSDADVVTMYLRPYLNFRLLPQLVKLKDGARLVSHDFEIPGVPEIEKINMGNFGSTIHHIYHWKTPLTFDPDFVPDERGPVYEEMEYVRKFIDWPKPSNTSKQNESEKVDRREDRSSAKDKPSAKDKRSAKD